MPIIYRNLWGSPESNVDQQRADMFRVSVSLPRQLLQDSGSNVWDREIAWAVEKFPFPSRSVESIPIKHLQQVNHQIGGDTAAEPIDMTVRYAFAQRVATLLERWHWLIHHPQTGGVALSSRVKTNGFFYWLVPNVAVLGNEGAAERDAYQVIRAYKLEGCYLRDVRPSDADMTSGNGLVSLMVSMQIDRYYPVATEDLRTLSVPQFAQ